VGGGASGWCQWVVPVGGVGWWALGGGYLVRQVQQTAATTILPLSLLLTDEPDKGINESCTWLNFRPSRPRILMIDLRMSWTLQNI